MEKPKKKATFLEGVINNAKSSGSELTAKNAASIAEQQPTPTPVIKEEVPVPKPHDKVIVKVSMDLRGLTDSNIKNAMYWGRMESRAEVVETALAEYFANHPDLTKPIPPKKK